MKEEKGDGMGASSKGRAYIEAAISLTKGRKKGVDEAVWEAPVWKFGFISEALTLCVWVTLIVERRNGT